MKFLNTNALPAGYQLQAVIPDPVMTKYTRFIICSAQDLIILNKSIPNPVFGREDEPGFRLSQAEFPLGALPWMVDTIENKFWKPPSKGGLPNSVLHVNNLVADEDLMVRHAPQCSDEGDTGIYLKNYSRKPIDAWGNSQDVLLPNGLLRDAGLMDLFKQLIEKYKIPYPEVKDAPPARSDN
jgi:hypothetical protein